MMLMTDGQQHQAENALPAFRLSAPSDASPLELAILMMVAKARQS